MTVKKNPSARKTEVVVQELKGEMLIYDLQNNKAYCLNETSALVYGLCDGNNSVSEIGKQLSKQLKQPVTDDLIWLAIDQLKEDNLLEDSSELETKFNGLSRREAIRKVGLASMIALPVIASLVAPKAADAASAGSCIANGHGCGPPISKGNCCAGLSCDDSGICAPCLTTGTDIGGVFLTPITSAAQCSASSGVCCSGSATYNVGTSSCTCN